MFLMRPEYYGMTEPILMKDKEYPVQELSICSIAKNRHGSTKNIPMQFVGNTMHFKTHYLTDRNEMKPMVQSSIDNSF